MFVSLAQILIVDNTEPFILTKKINNMKKRFITYEVLAAYAKAMQKVVKQDMTSEDARDVLETIDHLLDYLPLPGPDKPSLEEKKEAFKTSVAFNYLDEAAYTALNLWHDLKTREDGVGVDLSDCIEDGVDSLSLELAGVADLDLKFNSLLAKIGNNK